MLLVLVQFFFYFSFCVVLEKAVKHGKATGKDNACLKHILEMTLRQHVLV